jgi:hypothetical protein
MRRVSLTYVLIVALIQMATPVAAAQQDPQNRNAAWQGQYFNNRYLSGAPLLARYDPELAFNWGWGSPDPSLPADEFSARWQRDFYANQGRYRVSTRADDGVRVILDGQPVIDQWRITSATDYAAELSLGMGWHTVVVEYFEASQGAELQVDIQPIGAAPPAPSATWTGEYFANTALAGTPWLVRQDPSIDFQWGLGPPASNLPADNFSVRWTREVYFDTGIHRFTARTDDGARLFVDGALVLDHWQVQAAADRTVDLPLAAGVHRVQLEYFEGGGEASARLAWQNLGGGGSLPPSSWLGEYYGNAGLSGPPALVRADPSIDFDWGLGAPAAGLPADRFSARWTATLPLDAGRYRFDVDTDDSARLFVDNQPLIDHWLGQPVRASAEVSLGPGPHAVRLEYQEVEGNARARLGWQRIDSGPPPPAAGWFAEYFANPHLQGWPAVSRSEAAVDFNWAGGSPDPAIPVDYFSARWTQQLSFTAGRYRFTTRTDDGVRLFVNNVLLLDRWQRQGAMPQWAEIDLPAGQHAIRLEYFEEGGAAEAHLTWEKVTGGGGGATDGWYAEFFNNPTLIGSPAATRYDSAIGFDWGSGAPHPGIAPDQFSVRWTRQAQLNRGRYRFTSETDDGVRLWIDGTLLIDQWQIMSRTRFSREITLDQGVHTLRMEVFDGGGAASARLDWERVEEKIIPSQGNIVTCLAPPPASSWIKIYQLAGDQWRDVNPNGWGALDSTGQRKIDALPVDVPTYGDQGHPYRVEVWRDGALTRSVGNIHAGEPEFRVKGGQDSHTPWPCPP